MNNAKVVRDAERGEMSEREKREEIVVEKTYSEDPPLNFLYETGVA